MVFKCSFEDASSAPGQVVANRDCGGSADSAAELFAGRMYDAVNPERPVPERIVVVEFNGVRKRFTVTSRVEFEATEIHAPPGADETGKGGGR